jgi:hypothetical protein
MGVTIQSEEQADVAQLVEQLIRNQQVVSSSLTVGSIHAAVPALLKTDFDRVFARTKIGS